MERSAQDRQCCASCENRRAELAHRMPRKSATGERNERLEIRLRTELMARRRSLPKRTGREASRFPVRTKYFLAQAQPLSRVKIWRASPVWSRGNSAATAPA